MTVYAAIALCFIPYITTFIIAALLVPGLKVRYELWATLIALLSVIPIIFIQYALHSLPLFTVNSFISLLLTAILFNGLIEEAAKMIFMLLLPSKKLKLSAFFTTAILCGFAFGCFESVIYFLKALQETTTTGATMLYNQIFLRMFTSVVIHATCAGFSGLYIWSYRNKDTHIMLFIWAAILHGLYNFFAAFNSPYHWFSLVTIFFTIIECRLWYKKIAESESIALDKQTNKH